MNKTILTTLTALLLAAASSRGVLFTETFNGVNTAIPDGNPNGVAFAGNVNDIPLYPSIPSSGTVLGLTVSLNVSGGYNGNLYAYLVAPNGTLVVLMNQPGMGVNGFGAGGAGMDITLQDGTAGHGSIQNETGGGLLSGSYNAAGSLSAFDGSAANGTWTLYFADLTSGGGTSILEGWSLGITAVPEPENLALLLFGLILVGAGSFRWFFRAKTHAGPTSC